MLILLMNNSKKSQPLNSLIMQQLLSLHHSFEHFVCHHVSHEYVTELDQYVVTREMELERYQILTTHCIIFHINVEFFFGKLSV